jgi:EAL and modified HD-GYP domain-containing signal transduction protein
VAAARYRRGIRTTVQRYVRRDPARFGHDGRRSVIRPADVRSRRRTDRLADAIRTQELLLGRQPIVDRDRRLFAFELLFRGSRRNSARPCDDVMATSQVLLHVFAELGVDRALGPHRGFVNCDERMLLMPGALDVLPADRVVLEILESVPPTPEILKRLRILKTAGFALALDDYRGASAADAFLNVVDYVKVDLPRIEEQALAAWSSSCARGRRALSPRRSKGRREAELCRAIGIDFFQGYFFARPSSSKAASSRCRSSRCCAS